MVSIDDAARIITRIHKDILACKGTRIWHDYINSLKLVAQVVFTRSSGFVLELIQNAEDAGLGLESKGRFRIELNQQRVKITHNGRPFNEEEVEALCGIRSSKKPEKGTLGYLGIGFKSVFKITDRPEVYSGGFQFKFDRNLWDEPGKTPWHVIPVWLEEPSETVSHDETTFVIPYREEACYPGLVEEIGGLKTELYLFFRWLKRIEVIDEVSGRRWTLEGVDESEEGITTLRHDGQEQRFKFFRRVCQVPDWLKQDRLTQEYRADVTQREIVIAFALDSAGNLAPSEAGAMYGGVYSFLPLAGAKSGAKFPIQADFLVQPGREEIQYESQWNHWLLEQVADLCKEAINYFKKHDTWKYQFLPAFEFTKSRGSESYEKLFGPKLIKPVEEFLGEDSCVPTAEGGWAKAEQVVRLSEDETVTEDLVGTGILKREDIAPVMGGQSDLKLVAPQVRESESARFRKIDRNDLLSNEDFLEEKCKAPNAADWFRRLYLWLQAHPRWIYTKKGGYQEGYWYRKIVLTADGSLVEGRNAWLPDFQLSDPLTNDLAKISQQSKAILHPAILVGAKDEEERKTLRGFILGLTGVQVLDSKALCKEAVLPLILTTAPKPLADDVLKYTTYCQQILGEDIPPGSEFWVLTKQGDVRVAKETLLPRQFRPERDWETHQNYVPGLNFVSPAYLAGATNEGELTAWRQFFRVGGVKDSPDNGVYVFAINYAREKLGPICKPVLVDMMNFGYDLEGETQTGEKMRIEVKGLTHDQDIELSPNETETAERYGDSFYLCVVSSVPENPSGYLVKNPTAVGRKEKITIPVNIWKASSRL